MTTPAIPTSLAPRLTRMHRGYEIRIHKKNHWRAKHRAWRMFADLPLEFTWTDTREWDALRAYIDAWYKGDSTLRGLFEERGLATEVEFPDPSHFVNNDPTQVNAARFFDCLKLSDRITVPLWTKVRFVTDGHNLVPATWIQMLIDADPVGFAHLKNSKGPWRLAKETDLDKMDLQVSEVTSGMYSEGMPERPGIAPPKVRRDRARLAKIDPVTAARVAASTQEQSESADDAAEDLGDDTQSQQAQGVAPITIKEHLIRRQQHDDGVIDLISQSVPTEGNPWFNRRILYKGRCIYAANSWVPCGPWTVWQRDDATLMALEIII